MPNTIRNLRPETQSPQKGDLYIKDGDIYMLSQVGSSTFVCVCLSTGNRYHDPGSIKHAIEGLKFLARGAHITVE